MAEDVAFLRGINVGGHGAVTMEDLKKAFEACAFKDVKTIATRGATWLFRRRWRKRPS